MENSWIKRQYGSLMQVEAENQTMDRNERLLAVREPLLSWYHKNRRILPWREQPESYRVWISEIMLQQTRVEAVKPYFARFMEALPDVKALASVEEETLLKLWEGLGYYNRARNLQKAARVCMDEYGGQLPASYESLLSLQLGAIRLALSPPSPLEFLNRQLMAMCSGFCPGCLRAERILESSR